MVPLKKVDLEWAVRRLPDGVYNIITSNRQVMCGGGFIRATIAGEEISDIDLFSCDYDSARTIAKCYEYYESENAFSFREDYQKVQIVHRWTFSSLEDLINAFDFTISKAAFCLTPSGEWRSLCDDDFYADL